MQQSAGTLILRVYSSDAQVSDAHSDATSVLCSKLWGRKGADVIVVARLGSFESTGGVYSLSCGQHTSCSPQAATVTPADSKRLFLKLAYI